MTKTVTIGARDSGLNAIDIISACICGAWILLAFAAL